MFFDLSLPEIVVLLGLGVVLFGPDKLPQNAARAAQFIRQIRAFSDSAREGLRNELGPEFDGLDLQDLNPKTFVRKNLLGEAEDLRSLRAELNADLNADLKGDLRGTLDESRVGVLAAGERPAYDEEAT